MRQRGRGFQVPRRKRPKAKILKQTGLPGFAALLRQDRMCYKRRAVESTLKPASERQTFAATSPGYRETATRVGDPTSGGTLSSPVNQAEDASRYCSICSQRLAARHCKLVC